MPPRVRTQTDGKQDEISRKLRRSFQGTDDHARQEFKNEQDINKMLARYGVPGAVAAQRATIGEVNFDMDLQQSLHMLQETRAAYNRLPADLQQKYGSWQAILAAIEAGELTELPKEGKKHGDQSGTTPAEGEPGVSRGAPAGGGDSHDRSE